MTEAVETPPRSRRSGGRAARTALRSAPLSEDKRPVRPGLSGGQYKPLTDAQVQRIHEAALQALEEIGLSQALEDGCTDAHITPELALPLQRHYAIGLLNGHLRDSPGSLALMTQEAGEALAPGMFELRYEP